MRGSASPTLLLWGLAAVQWAVPAAAQQVTGITTGINSVTGERPARQNINDLYTAAGPHWDLYVQALDLFQREDMSDVMSYYQIAGIHGLPFVSWNGVEQVSGGGNTGYCPHGQTSFVTWHRPYLALYEQALASYAQKVAMQYPADTIQKYKDAANTFRMPYWDWAVDAHMPPATTATTIIYNSPAGPAIMRNPLYSYQFPQFPFPSTGGFGGDLTKYNETKRCITTSGDGAGVSDHSEGNTVLMDDANSLQDRVYAVFTQSTTFESMATMSNSGASFEGPHNVIHNDISCFSVSGRTGTMGDLNWSGFEPLFFLHHTNVDRLVSMWQAINYNDTMFTTSQKGGAAYGTAAGDMTPDSPLRPFAKTVNADGTAAEFHTSRTVEKISTFGYTYPEIDDWSQDAETLADKLRETVNSLYGPNANTVDAAASKRSASGRHHKKSVVNDIVNDVLAAFDYNVEISVDRSEIPLPSTIELYLDGVTSDVASTLNAALSAVGGSVSVNTTSCSIKIGSTNILSMPMTGTTYSMMPLRRALTAETATGAALALVTDPNGILEHLRASLRVVIKTPEGEVVPLSSVPSLTMEVQQRAYKAQAACNKFPKYGSIFRYAMDAISL